MRRVVVTGMGIVGSLGNNCAETLVSLREARSGVVNSDDQIQMSFRSHVYAPPGCDPFEILPHRITRFMGCGSAWNWLAILQALEDSGLEKNEVSNVRTGLIIGSGAPSTSVIVHSAEITRLKSPKRIGPFGVPKTMSSTASATSSVPLQIKGICYSISSACATSSHCIGNAAEMISWGKQDVMFAGGSEDVAWAVTALFDAMGALSSHFNETPAVASRAFDAARDGFVISGGAGVLILEELEHAKARGAKIYAELVGYGATCDGSDMVAPSGEGAVRCMRQAIQDAKIPIDYINPHATSTVLGDLKEIEAIREVFGADKCPPISATKSLSGHALGAAGAHEAIYTILMMQNGFLCKSAHIDQIDPAMADMNILRERKDNVQISCALSNAFGFGGTNAALVFKHPDA